MKINKQEVLDFFKSLYIKLRPILAGILAFFVLFFGYNAYKYFLGYHITAEFSELGPMRQSMPVYYKGFKVGRTGRINPNSDYSSSNMRIILNRNLNHLPDNIIAKVKKFEQEQGDGSASHDYIELMYPEVPSAKFIRRGSIVKGRTAVDMQSFMSSQAESGSFTIISDNMGKTLESAEKTSDELRLLIADIRDTLKENRASINVMSKNLAVATEGISNTSANLGEITRKLNTSFSEEQVSDIMKNIETTTKSINSTTENIDKATKNLDKTMSEVDTVLGNVNQITGGTKNTLSKRFGTMRFMFGVPLR